MTERFFAVWLVAIWVVFSTVAASASPPRGSIQLGSENLVVVTHEGSEHFCGNLPPWSPGRMYRGYFYPTSSEIANLKRAIKRSRSSAQLSKLRKTLRTRKASLASGNAACLDASGGSGGGSGEGGGGGGGTTEGNFDAAGNVTATGKVAFEIPSQFNASVNAGLGAWNSSCKGCHQTWPMSLQIKKFPAIRDRIQLSPMFFNVPQEISEQVIADITAAANYP